MQHFRVLERISQHVIWPSKVTKKKAHKYNISILGHIEAISAAAMATRQELSGKNLLNPTQVAESGEHLILTRPLNEH